MVRYDSEELFWKNVHEEADAKSKIVWGAKDDIEFNVDTLEEAIFIKKHLSIDKDDVVLDYGAGIGRLMMPLSKDCKYIVGLDVSNAMVTHSKNYLKGIGNTQMLLCDSLGQAPVQPSSIDKIYSHIVLQHINKYKVLAILMNLKNYLAPGGKALFQFPDLLADERTFVEYARTFVTWEENNCSLHFWTQDEARKIFEFAGWKVIDIITESHKVGKGKQTDFWVVAE